MTSLPLPVDPEKDRADYETAEKLLGAMSERVKWIVYQQLYAQGHRIDRALNEIDKLAPRKTSC